MGEKSTSATATALLNDPAELRRALICAMRTPDHTPAHYKKMLEKYLSDCPVDTAAWRDLLTIALNEGDLQRARTIAEELACVQDPMNMFYLITLADICFAQGQYLIAGKYFCFVVACEPNMPRGLAGLITCVCKMLEKKDLYVSVIEEYVTLAERACGKLIEQYNREKIRWEKLGDAQKTLWFGTQAQFVEDIKSDLRI